MKRRAKLKTTVREHKPYAPALPDGAPNHLAIPRTYEIRFANMTMTMEIDMAKVLEQPHLTHWADFSTMYRLERIK